MVHSFLPNKLLNHPSPIPVHSGLPPSTSLISCSATAPNTFPVSFALLTISTNCSSAPSGIVPFTNVLLISSAIAVGEVEVGSNQFEL